jgi:hypothetical protein
MFAFPSLDTDFNLLFCHRFCCFIFPSYFLSGEDWLTLVFHIIGLLLDPKGVHESNLLYNLVLLLKKSRTVEDATD